MTNANKISDLQHTTYATHADFCRIFADEMTPLYLLSYLLTGDHEKAEQCFVAGLDDAGKGNRVFKEWAESWARRTIIQNAIQVVRPKPGNGTSAAASKSVGGIEPVELGAVAALPDFDRFVFVMSVLERYSNQECSLLLGCSRGDVIAARARALQQVGSSVQLRWKLHEAGKEQTTEQKEKGPIFPIRALTHLATTA